MDFNYSDALLLFIVSECQGKPINGAPLGNIISYWDYLDHSIPTFKELSDAARKLYSLELLDERDCKLLITSEAFSFWIDNLLGKKKRINSSKVTSAVMDYLKSDFADKPEKTTEKKLIVEPVYDQALQQYLKKCNG